MPHLMKGTKFFFPLFLLLLFSFPPLVCAELLPITTHIEIAKKSSLNRHDIFYTAFRQGFKNLLFHLTPPSAHYRIASVPQEQQLLRGIRVIKETHTPSVYTGVFEVLFDKKDTEAFLSSHEMPFISRPMPSFLLIPIGDEKLPIQHFPTPQPPFVSPKPNEIQPLLPIIKKGIKSSYLRIPSALIKLQQAYDCEGILILAFRSITQKGLPHLQVEASLFPGKIFHLYSFELPIQHEPPFTSALQKISHHIIRLWKEQNAHFMPYQHTTLTVQFSSLKNLVAVEKILQSLSEELLPQSASAHQVQYSMKHYHSLSSYEKALAPLKIGITPQKTSVWKIQASHD